MVEDMTDSQYQSLVTLINERHHEVRDDIREIFDRLKEDDQRRAEQGILPRVERLEKTSDGLLGKVGGLAGIVAVFVGGVWELARRVFAGGE